MQSFYEAVLAIYPEMTPKLYFYDLNENCGSFEMRLDLFNVKAKGFHIPSSVWFFFFSLSAELCDWRKQWQTDRYDNVIYLFFTVSLPPFCFSPRCLSSNEDERRILSFHLDKDTHTLYVAFSSCVVRIPLSRCERHSSCQKWVLNANLFIQAAQ